MLPVFERNKTLKKFILKRIYTAFIVVLFVVALNFFIIKLAPGDPVNIMAGFDNPSEEFKMAIRAKYNLDKPLITQFFTYIYRLVQGDLGESYYSNQPVTSLIAERMGASLLLSGTSAILAFVIGTLLGLAAGKKENRWQDKSTFSRNICCKCHAVFLAWYDAYFCVRIASWMATYSGHVYLKRELYRIG